MDKVKILNDIKLIIIEKTGLIVEKIYLFGSQINSSINNGSDFDILIILQNKYDRKNEYEIYDVLYEIMLKYDIILDIKIISIDELNSLRGKQPYIQSALRSGIYA